MQDLESLLYPPIIRTNPLRERSGLKGIIKSEEVWISGPQIVLQDRGFKSGVQAKCQAQNLER